MVSAIGLLGYTYRFITALALSSILFLLYNIIAYYFDGDLAH